MEDKNNGGLKLRSTEFSKLEIQSGDSAESIAGPVNTRRKMACTAQRVFVTAVDMINHALIILVTSYLVYHMAKELTVTNVHIITLTIGYVLLMSEAIMVLAGENILTSAFSRQTNKHIHWVLQVLGLICNFVGIGIMYNAKSAHFLSTHGILGLSSFVIMCTLAIFGYPVLIAVKLRKFVRPVVIKLVHNFLGISCFVLGMLAQCYGYKKRKVYKVTQVEDVDMALLVLTAVITLLSLRSALFSVASQTFALYVLMMSEAIMVLAGDNILTSTFSRQTNKHIHWILQVLGLILNLVGIGIMYHAIDPHRAHFLSIHAILGIASFVIMCVLAIFGYPVFVAVKLRKFVRPVVIKLVHNFLGISCFVLGILSQCYGYNYKLVYPVTQVEEIDMVLLVLTVVIMLLSLRGALFSLARQTFALVRSI